MPLRPLLDTEFSQRFFADILSLYPGSDRRYDCPGISDLHYCQLGVLRCLDTATTGQQFLQHHADQNVADIDPGHFFKALKSPRRLANITSLNDLLAQLPRHRHRFLLPPEPAHPSATQRTQRFIRWVRVRIYQRVPWSESVARLRELWTLQT